MATISANLQAVRDRISTAAGQAHRAPEEITLLAVSKTWPAEALRAAAACGQRHFGENYLQEALGKLDALHDLDLVWHFIGPLQSNKTRQIAQRFHWVHSVDRLKIAERLSAARAELGPDAPPLQVCLQVNISGETTKSGVPPEALPALALAVAALPHLVLRGLMAMPEPSEDPVLLRRRFAEVRQLRDRLNEHGLTLDTLSMGMSADLEPAILEGATLVRVGSALFGSRPPNFPSP